jgi:diguanylate cyclase (GGDEF)-like protein
LSSIASTLRRDFRRQTWLAVSALVLTAGGLIATLLDLEMDRSAERHYRAAIDREQRIVMAERFVAELRRWEVRADDAVGRGAANVEIDLQAAIQLANALGESVSSTRDSGDGPRRTALTDRIEAAARTIAGAAAAPAGGSAIPIAAANDVIRTLDRDQLPVIEDALLSLTAENQRELERSLALVRVEAGSARAALFGMSLLAATLAILLALVLARSIQGSRRLVNDLNQMAHEDSLTGLINRRQLDEVLPTEVARAQRAGSTVSVAMIDLDYFKRYNDQRGHAAGDGLLRGAAQAWREQMRPTDLLARYGGEEFTLVLPACTAEETLILLNRLRPLVPEEQTFSAGVATWNGVESAGDLLKRADRALLAAKRAGRNRTEIASIDVLDAVNDGTQPANQPPHDLARALARP